MKAGFKTIVTLLMLTGGSLMNTGCDNIWDSNSDEAGKKKEVKEKEIKEAHSKKQVEEFLDQQKRNKIANLLYHKVTNVFFKRSVETKRMIDKEIKSVKEGKTGRDRYILAYCNVLRGYLEKLGQKLADSKYRHKTEGQIKTLFRSISHTTPINEIANYDIQVNGWNEADVNETFDYIRQELEQVKKSAEEIVTDNNVRAAIGEPTIIPLPNAEHLDNLENRFLYGQTFSRIQKKEAPSGKITSSQEIAKAINVTFNPSSGAAPIGRPSERFGIDDFTINGLDIKGN